MARAIGVLSIACSFSGTGRIALGDALEVDAKPSAILIVPAEKLLSAAAASRCGRAHGGGGGLGDFSVAPCPSEADGVSL